MDDGDRPCGDVPCRGEEPLCEREFAIAPYPNLAQGPTPNALLSGSVVGIRRPITLPPDGGPIDRPAAIAYFDYYYTLRVDVAGKFTGYVVDDKEA
jgi:hypothetical protein